MKKKFYVNAMVVYGEYVEAEDFEEAVDKFVESCPYDFESDSICAYDKETGEERTGFF